LEKPGFQEKTAALVRRIGGAAWMIQPTLAKTRPGFARDLKEVKRRLGQVPQVVRQSASVLSALDRRLHRLG
jgi:hypothetical protein